MLRKIKKYKISVRPSAAARFLKKKLSSEAPLEELEKSLEGEIARAEPLVVPQALFNTYSKKDTPEPLKSIWEQAEGKVLSVSILGVTIGTAFEKALRETPVAEAPRAAVLDSIAREALDQSVHFVVKLISDEAKDEGCELSPLWPVAPELADPFLKLLEAHKADIYLDETRQITPLYSKIGFCFWHNASRR